MSTHDENYRMTDHDKRLAGLAVSHGMSRRAVRAHCAEVIGLAHHARFFDGFDDATLAMLNGHADEFHYPARWAFITQGTVVERCFILLGGSAIEYDHGVPGSTYGPGSAVGLVDAYAGHAARGTCVADEEVWGLAVESSVLIELFRDFPMPAVAAPPALVPAPRHREPDPVADLRGMPVA